MMRIVLALLILLAGCSHSPTLKAPQPGEADVEASGTAGWEGFFPVRDVDDAWLARRGIPLRAEALARVRARVAKIAIAYGPMEAPEEELAWREERYCGDEAVRAWNVACCEALEARQCADGTCAYEHYGNCSGLLLRDGLLLTAAHCVADLAEDAELCSRSEVLVPGSDGRPARSLDLGEIRIGKSDFSHHWVALGEEDPVDVASVAVEVEGLEPYPLAELPSEGDVIFIMGYPRVERRSPEDRRAAGYDLVFGTPSVSFGRLADRNEADLPLCNVDGWQEHWTLAESCPEGETTVEGVDTWTGVITRSPFLTTFDSCNGYSGAPVLDEHGRLIGVNVTLIGPVNPQERFHPETRMVAIPVRRALSRLNLEKE